MTLRTLTLTLLALPAMAVQAHEGHGLPGSSHWHAADAMLVGAAAVVAAGWWWSRRK
jgi:hypothetical protein